MRFTWRVITATALVGCATPSPYGGPTYSPLAQVTDAHLTRDVLLASYGCDAAESAKEWRENKYAKVDRGMALCTAIARMPNASNKMETAGVNRDWVTLSWNLGRQAYAVSAERFNAAEAQRRGVRANVWLVESAITSY